MRQARTVGCSLLRAGRQDGNDHRDLPLGGSTLGKVEGGPAAPVRIVLEALTSSAAFSHATYHARGSSSDSGWVPKAPWGHQRIH
jgi:hypothetical protein